MFFFLFFLLEKWLIVSYRGKSRKSVFLNAIKSLFRVFFFHTIATKAKSITHGANKKLGYSRIRLESRKLNEGNLDFARLYIIF